MLKIGELARDSGASVATIRYYERLGLVEAVARTPAGYRQFDSETVRRLRFIRRAQALGFTLADIRELLDLRLDPDASAQDVRQRATRHLATIDTRLEELSRIREALRELVAECEGSTSPTCCPILDRLEG